MVIATYQPLSFVGLNQTSLIQIQYTCTKERPCINMGEKPNHVSHAHDVSIDWFIITCTSQCYACVFYNLLSCLQLINLLLWVFPHTDGWCGHDRVVKFSCMQFIDGCLSCLDENICMRISITSFRYIAECLHMIVIILFFMSSL